MTDPLRPSAGDTDETATVRLLRLAESRAPVPPAVTARVRAAVRDEWRARVRRRRIVRRRLLAAAMGLAAVAGLVLAVGRLDSTDRRAPAGEPVAVVERVDGVSRLVSGGSHANPAARLAPDAAIHAGDWLETDDQARVALRFASGVSVRLDAASRARAVSSTVVEVTAGGVYVDTGGDRGRFEVRTAWATARDVGTQFELRLIDRALRLRVRSGLVELHGGAQAVSAGAGTEITLSEAGAASRAVATYGPEWDWTLQVAPPLVMEKMGLAAFLERVGREHGWTVRYDDAALLQEAAGIILHGSVEGLAPREAVEVAIATSGLQHRFTDGELIVFRSSPQPAR